MLVPLKRFGGLFVTSCLLLYLSRVSLSLLRVFFLYITYHVFVNCVSYVTTERTDDGHVRFIMYDRTYALRSSKREWS